MEPLAIKHRRRAFLLTARTGPSIFPRDPMRVRALLVSALFWGCGPIIEQAAFHARPDTTLPGDLLGPYDGRVLDGDTEKPVPGALVVASWSFQRGVGFVGPSGSITRQTETDVDGKYSIARLRELPGGLSTRVDAFTLIIYKRGFVGYRSDRFFRDGAPRYDFAQRANLVRLERFSDDLSHAHHLAFVGGAPPVRKAAAWEIEMASAELEGTRKPGLARTQLGPATTLAPPPLDAWPLLKVADVKAATGYTGEFEEERLGDLPRTSFYDSHHFKAVGEPEKLDLALRLWKLPALEADAQWKKLSESLPGAKATDEIGTHSVRAGEGDILAVAWFDQPQGVIVQISCGRGQCSDYPVVLKLAALVRSRLNLLSPTGPAATPEKKLDEDVPGEPKPPTEKPFQLTPPELKPHK